MIEIKFHTDDATSSISNELRKGYTKILNLKLASFENEINKYNGTIILKMTGENNEADLFFKNMPLQLIDTLKRTLAQ